MSKYRLTFPSICSHTCMCQSLGWGLVLEIVHYIV